MTTTKQYDYLNRLQSVSSTGPGIATPESFSYTYNAANQRTRATLGDGSYWLYQYDELGQVTGGKKYWSDGTLVAGEQMEYGFDQIGNRTNLFSVTNLSSSPYQFLDPAGLVPPIRFCRVFMQ
ncbi:MAG: hypothetical protein ACR2H1_15395 [Limisphaerales bacterium]